jgi:hypothetical protein
MKLLQNSNIAKFNFAQGAAIGGTLGTSLGMVGGGVLNRQHIMNSLTPEEQQQYDDSANRFNTATDAFLAKNRFNIGIATPNSDDPLARDFVNSGQEFLDNDQAVTNKYSNPYLTMGLPLAGAAVGGTLGAMGAGKYIRGLKR